MANINFQEIEVGDVFSELSHYIAVRKESNGLVVKNLKTNEEFLFHQDYVANILTTADQFTNEVKVGKEDKLWTAKQIADAVANGDLPADHKVSVGDVRVEGIRTLFENIHSQHVFTVSFNKADTQLSNKKYQEALKEQRERFIELIEKAKSSKKSMRDAAEQGLLDIQNNPVLPFVKGEERVLRGYKTQFTSRDGRYDCMDMDINEIRPVNINTLNWLVYKGTKYIVE